MAFKIRWNSTERAAFLKRWLEFREKYGISQRRFAAMVGITQREVVRIEKGRVEPRETSIATRPAETAAANADETATLHAMLENGRSLVNSQVPMFMAPV